jgi:hypothetical protein
MALSLGVRRGLLLYVRKRLFIRLDKYREILDSIAMNKNLLIAVIVVLLAGILIYVFAHNQTAQAPTTLIDTITPIATSTTTSTTTTTTTSGTTHVKVALISLNDNGKSGTAVGCGDSVVFVDRQVPATQAPLRTALEQLLSIKSQTYGQSGLYNALYQSNLKVDDVAITNGTATIHLSGTTQLGGVCDDPRFAAQLTQTALQFDTVKKVNIFVNGKTLQEVTSEK